MKKIIVRKIDWPKDSEDINYNEYPLIEKEDYYSRILALVELASEKGFTHLLVYGDREHFSNLDYLIGYDPRFEESLLIINRHDNPMLILGNEGLDYSNKVSIKINKELFQSFSLMGQPRDRSKDLVDIFKSAGINRSSKVGVIGWKYFSEREITNSKYCIEIPCFIIEVLTELVDRKSIENLSYIMMHPEYGLRIKLGIKELVKHEFAGTKTSRKVLNTINMLKVGLSEMEASKFFNIDGEPLTTHPNISFGSNNVSLGLASPEFNNKLALGDVISVGLGYRRAMVHRTGLYVRTKKEISNDIKNIVEFLYIPYFRGLIAWYESIRIGRTGGEVFKNIENILGGFKKYGIELNPGHSIHTDEWTNSLFYKNSSHKIVSGMALQCDIISSAEKPYIGVHVEDGIIIADNNTRIKIKKSFPKSWERIIKRRKFMKEILGISLEEEVLPTSDMQALLFPFLADTNLILSR